MKKVSLLLVLFLFPFMVLAKDTCDSNDIVIQSITLEKSTGHIEELNEASIDNQKINLGLKMDVVGDSAEYKVVVKNNADEDYYFDERALNIDMDSVNYEVSFDDNTSLIKAGEEKVIYLKVSYKEQMDATNFDNGLYDGTQVMKLNVMTLENPFTGRFLGLLILMSLLFGFFVLYRDKKKTAYLLLLISFTIPFSVKAVCRHSLEVNTNFVIDARNAIFLPGKEFNIKVKQLVGDDTTTSTNGYNFRDQLITAFRYSDVEPVDSNKEEKNIVSVPESRYPIYAWFDNGTLYWWSEDKTPALENPSYMFFYFFQLSDLSGIENFDSSNVEVLDYFIVGTQITNLNYLANWNVENLIQMGDTFALNQNMVDITGLSNWNISNVETLSFVFYSANGLRNLEGIKNWDTSNVTNMQGLFYNCGIESLVPLRNWNISNVINLGGVFEFCTNLVTLEGLENWDTSNVENMSFLFDQNTSLVNIDAIKNWDVSKVTTMRQLFCSAVNLEEIDLSNWKTDSLEDMINMFGMWNSNGSSRYDSKLKRIIFSKKFNTTKVVHMDMAFVNLVLLESIEGIEYWNTPLLTTAYAMFSACFSLTSLDISNFDTRNVTDFRRMFDGCNRLETIYVGDKWSTESNTEATSPVFSNQMRLRNFDPNNPNCSDLSYAHTGEGGYLTLKTD